MILSVGFLLTIEPVRPHAIPSDLFSFQTYMDRIRVQIVAIVHVLADRIQETRATLSLHKAKEGMK
jgi:hypothetical protein